MTHIKEEVIDSALNLFDKDKMHPFISNNKEDLLIFDIETTGLSHQYTNVILIGYMYIKNERLYIDQLFAETPDEELEILLKFYEITKSFRYFVSYNGNSFDIPYLNSRFKFNGLNIGLDKSMNIDLLRVARKLSKELSLVDYKLKTVEKFLGIYREDGISGKESVDLYNRYVMFPSPTLKKTILLHNYEDILYLGKVIDLLHYQSGNDLSNIPQYFCYKNDSYYIGSHKIRKDFITLTLYSRNKSEKRLHFSPGQLTFEQSGHSIELKIPLFTLKLANGEHQFIDIDLITDGDLKFNSMAYESKMKCHITPYTLNHLVTFIFKQLNL